MTTTVLRPNATVISSASVTGAASAHAATSDDSDSSYLTFSLGNSVLLELGTVAMAGGVTKTIQCAVRHSSDDTDLSIIDAEVRSGASGLAEVSGIALDTSPLTSTGVAIAVTLTQAQIDGLRLELDLSTSDAARVYELYANLVWVAIPVTTVTAVSPDPYTASNIIPIAWTNTLDADGGGQTRYEVKVYTDAQYGAGGFDPDTSTPYWTSGEIVGSALTVNTGALATGDTYRAYVRVAQTVNGASHWSAWAFDTFDVDVDTADIDTITATPHDSLGHIVIDVTRDALSEAWDFIEVQRSTDSGVTWSPVRFANYVDATGDADDFQVTDYEVGNGTNVLYRARATYLLSDLPITGEWVTTAAVTAWSSTDCWLKAPLDPTLNTTFCMSARNVYARNRRVGRFDVIGSATPVVVSDVLSSHTGTLTIETYDSTDATDLRSLLERAAVLLVQFPASMDIADVYASIVTVDEVFLSANSDNLWRLWSAAYAAVTAPADPTAGQ